MKGDQKNSFWYVRFWRIFYIYSPVKRHVPFWRLFIFSTQHSDWTFNNNCCCRSGWFQTNFSWSTPFERTTQWSQTTSPLTICFTAHRHDGRSLSWRSHIRHVWTSGDLPPHLFFWMWGLPPISLLESYHNDPELVRSQFTVSWQGERHHSL